MRTNSFALKNAIQPDEIERVVSLRQTFDVQKRRLELAENTLNEVEQDLIARIKSGATVHSDRDVQLKSVERRNVAWKGIVCELIGSERTEAILATTEPTITCRLLVK